MSQVTTTDYSASSVLTDEYRSFTEGSTAIDRSDVGRLRITGKDAAIDNFGSLLVSERYRGFLVFDCYAKCKEPQVDHSRKGSLLDSSITSRLAISRK